jgi:hypothetical protein
MLLFHWVLMQRGLGSRDMHRQGSARPAQYQPRIDAKWIRSTAAF